MATEGETPDDRLNELLRKSRLFADFVAGKSSCAASELSSKKKKSSRRGRMKESEEVSDFDLFRQISYDGIETCKKAFVT
eukprot:986851-Amorphochlora_amoeboformis.AAC.2